MDYYRFYGGTYIMKKLIIFLILLLPILASAEVKQIDLKVSMTELEALKTVIITDKDAVYDTLKQELTFKANRATGTMWRLVHDGVNVITIIEGTADSVTTTIHQKRSWKVRHNSYNSNHRSRCLCQPVHRWMCQAQIPC